MDKEFLFLAIVCLVTLAFVVVSAVTDFPAEQESDVWGVCEQPLGNEQVRDCELRQMIEDVNKVG